MADANLEILKQRTYLTTIENSVGSTQYRSLFVRYQDSGEEKDILENGELSCAYFVSSVLYLFGMLDKQRATVASVLRHVNESPDWTEVSVAEAEPGDVVFYEEREFERGTRHAHVGFVLNGEEAVSTSDTKKCVTKHQLDYHPIESVWRYSW